MKTSILLLSVVLSACTPRQHITGHIEGLDDDTLIVHSCAIADLPAASSDPTRSIPRDTLVVRNGRLAFDRPVDQPTIFTIRPAQTVMRIPGGHRWFSSVSDIVFFLDAGERIEIRACVDSIYTDYSLAGSRLNKTWSRYRAGQFELQKELTRLMLRLDQAEAAEAVSIQTTLRSLQQRVFGSATRYIREHPSEPLSGYLLASVPADSAAVCIDRLDDAVRHSVFSPLIAHAAGKSKPMKSAGRPANGSNRATQLRISRSKRQTEAISLFRRCAGNTWCSTFGAVGADGAFGVFPG